LAWRVRRLREAIGASPHPFDELPKRPNNHARFDRIVRQIMLLEHGIMARMGAVADSYERKARLGKLIP
jgi:hypothetical protein